jgi:sec-independent protein translocase protein TatC
MWKKLRKPRAADDGDESKPFIEHLEDLRDTLVRCVGALAVGMIVAGPLAPSILEWLQVPLRPALPAGVDVKEFLWSYEVLGAFNLAMKVIIWSGIVMAAPFLVLFIARFVFPGLTAKEKHVIRRSSGAAVGLFVFGVVLAYRFCLPVALKAMFGIYSWMGIRPQWTISSYAAFSLQFLLAFGIVFEMPMVLVVLGKLGLVTSSFLRTYRRHVYVGLFILAAILTPPDIFSQLLMGGPLVILYEICILIIRATERKAAQAEGGPAPAKPDGPADG